MELSQKQKALSRLFSEFLRSRSKFEHIEKKRMILIANVFPKLGTSKNVVR